MQRLEDDRLADGVAFMQGLVLHAERVGETQRIDLGEGRGTATDLGGVIDERPPSGLIGADGRRAGESRGSAYGPVNS